MSIRSQSLILIVLILLSLTLTRLKPSLQGFSESKDEMVNSAALSDSRPSNFSFQRASLLNQPIEVRHGPQRKWEVLDPEILAEAVLIESLDDQTPFFYYNTYKRWPLASLTKLLTVLVVFENIGLNKKIPINETAVKNEGESGNIRPEEVYTAQDLIKIMLLTSSNDAAAAFEEYVGGRAEFVKMLNQEARELRMSQTILHDASGLSDLNESSATDLLRLTKYIWEQAPEIMSWTRLPSFLVQPINKATSRTVYNINPFVDSGEFLGGKTGTSPETKENLVAVFSLNNHRLVFILLGSPNRVEETAKLLKWVREAYDF